MTLSHIPSEVRAQAVDPTAARAAPRPRRRAPPRGPRPRRPRRSGDAADEIVAAWLASLGILGSRDVTHPLRCRVREELLVRGHRGRDEHRIRCLGLLGPDLDVPSETALRDLARDAPSNLHPCLEQSFAPISLSVHRLDLLLTLTEAYYIEKPERDDGSPWYHRRLHDEGIRRHHGVGGFGSPLANVARWHRRRWAPPSRLWRTWLHGTCSSIGSSRLLSLPQRVHARHAARESRHEFFVMRS